MKRAKKIALALALLFLGGNAFAKSEEMADISKLPKAVQKTVREQVADGKIVRIQKEMANRHVAYGVECVKDGRKQQIEVAPDGKLLLRAEEVVLTNLTSAVQKTIQDSATNGRIESIANVTENGTSYYEAGVTFNGQEKTFIVAADGKLIDTQIPENQIRLPGNDPVSPRNGEPPGGGYSQQN